MTQPVGKTRDPVNEIVRKNLRAFRERAGLTTEKVAAFCGISIDSLRRYEGNGAVPVRHLAKLAEIYGHSIGDFTLENPPEPNLNRRPGVALIELDGVNIDPKRLAEIQRLIAEANQDMRGRKGKR